MSREIFNGIRNICLPVFAGLMIGHFLCSGAAAAQPGDAKRTIYITSSPTSSNMVCSAGVCEPTNAGTAFLNVTQLETLLASQSVRVRVYNANQNIVVNAPVTWSSTNNLTLSAPGAVVKKDITVTGAGGLLFVSCCDSTDTVTLDGGVKINFGNTSGRLSILGISYTLANSIAGLAAAAAHGNVALANDYDASADGTYSSSPIPSLARNFYLNGLGHTISNLSISDPVAGDNVGLVGMNSATIFYLHLAGVMVKGAAASNVGGIDGAGGVTGLIEDVSVSGSVSTGATTAKGIASAGLIVGEINSGAVRTSFASGKVEGGENADVGGIAGEIIDGEVLESFSTATVLLKDGACHGCSIGAPENSAGGIVGACTGSASVGWSYSTGPVTGGAMSNTGGLIGYSDTVDDTEDVISYSTGPVSAGAGSSVGGAIGFQTGGNDSDLYWDISTSGISNSSQGVGNTSNAYGVEGMTTTQLQSGLPVGFTSDIWGESSGINNGLPYILAVPPKK